MRKLTLIFSFYIVLVSISFGSSIYFRNTTENPVSIWAQVSKGTVEAPEGDVYEDVVVEPGQSVSIDAGNYWHLYLIGTDLTTGESWDSDFNPGVHAPLGDVQLDWVGAYNGGGFSVSELTDLSLVETATALTTGLSFQGGQWSPTP